MTDNQEPAWQRYLTDYNEGLGVVYERLMLNDYLEGILARHDVRTVLEAPIFGMSGVSGINSVILARKGCQVTLVDEHQGRLEGVEAIWKELELPCSFVCHQDMAHLPFSDGAFDLAWNFAALWYVQPVAQLLSEMRRVSRKLIFICMPNPWQVGYWIRKLFLDRAFFEGRDETWVSMGRVKRELRRNGVKILDEGVMDVPPWPDTCMPAADVLRKLGIRSQALDRRFSGSEWEWSTMDYYLGRKPELRERIDRYAFLDRAPLPWQIKSIWAHHRYVLGRV